MTEKKKKKILTLFREREHPPRFAHPGTFEFEYAMRWKALMEMEKQQYEQVDRNMKEAQEKLEVEMEAARHEHQVMLMRQGKRGLLWMLGKEWAWLASGCPLIHYILDRLYQC